MNAVEIQRQYYAQTAHQYEEMHGFQDTDHMLAMYLLASYIEFYKIQSVLDVGAGTGRSLRWLKGRFPHLVVRGLEPVKALREQGYAKGLTEEDLVSGDATRMPFADNSFDLVCEFAVLHHIPHPAKAVQEMSRVASKMVCISDSNFMAQGSMPLRLIKWLIFSLGLWPIADWVKTGGKGYTISEGDGLAYSYSVYQNLPQLNQCWRKIRKISLNGMSDLTLGQKLSASQLLLVAHEKR